MLADPRSAALADNFAGQWLEMRNLDVVKPDPQKFPEWSPELRDAMKTETRMFFDSILRENRPIADFLDARYTFLNERLAKYYGIDGVTGPDFRRVELTTPERGGMLSQASVLTVSSYPTRTSVVIRGKYILQNILGFAASASAAGRSGARRRRGRASGVAAAADGKASRRSGLRVLPQQDGPAGLRPGELRRRSASGGRRTASSRWTPAARCRTARRSPARRKCAPLLKSQLPQFARCMVEKMLTYSLGRGLGRTTGGRWTRSTASWAAADYPFQSLIFEVVRSLPFQSRRGERGEQYSK